MAEGSGVENFRMARSIISLSLELHLRRFMNELPNSPPLPHPLSGLFCACALFKVLVSIQSLIFVAEPYFNEPGFESQLGTIQVLVV